EPTKWPAAAHGRPPREFFPECRVWVPYNRESASDGPWLAWASIATPDWTRIWFLVISAVSAATSTSTIRELAAARLAEYVAMFDIVVFSRFCMAPTPARRVEMPEMAELMAVMAASAPEVLLIVVAPIPSALALESAIEMVRRSLLEVPLPTWKESPEA